MFDFDAAKAARDTDLRAAEEAEEAKQRDIDDRTLELCRDFSAFAKKSGQAISASRHGDTVTLDAGPQNKLKVRVLPNDLYNLSFDGQDNDNHVYDTLSENQLNGAVLPRRIVEWMFGD